MYATKYAVAGALIGLVLGALIGLGILSQLKKSERGRAAPLAIGGMILGGLITGGSIGRKMGAEEDKLSALGLLDVQEQYFQDRRSWVGMSTWSNPKTGKAYTLITAKAESKNICSALNNTIIINHQIQGANKVNIPKCHKAAFYRVRETFKVLGDWVGPSLGKAEIEQK